MLRKKTTMRRFLFVLCTAGISMTASAAEESLAADSSAFQQMLDSLGLQKSDLESKVRSTLMFGGSSPVSFSGEGRLKLQYHGFKDGHAEYLREDRSYLQSNWEGNESFVRIGMVARAGRNTVLWSKIGFQHTLPGTFINKKVAGDEIPNRHDKSNESAIIHEDMSAGIAVRTVPASFWLKMGAVHWTEASPLSIWKSQARLFAWEYLPFEVEQPIARYYEYNIALGEKTGRAAWNKKAFQGINFESINLPANLYFNLLYGSYERYDNAEREYSDLAADQGYAGDGLPIKGKGIGDPFRKVFHARFAAKEVLNKMTPGINFLRYNYNEDVVNSSEFTQNFFTNVLDTTKNVRSNRTKFDVKKVGTKAFYKEPWVGTVDLRGPISDKLAIHTDFALSRIDSTKFEASQKVLPDSTTEYYLKKSNASSEIRPAFYAHIENKYLIPLNVDLAVISKGFYSPTSFVTGVDGFYAFGANLVGAGKFMGRGEASPYNQNMAGVNLTFVPKLTGYGHLRIAYGQHFQLEAARDVLYFPYRLNGQDLFSFLHSSYNRWGNDPIDHSLSGKYNKRIGDESYATGAYNNPVGFEGGALHSDYLSMYEAFVPYENEHQANANLSYIKKSDTYGMGDQKDGSYVYSYVESKDGNEDTVTLRSNNAFVPVHRKFTFNLEADYAYDISKIFGYPRDLFFSVYGALNGVSTGFKPLAFNEKSDDMLLWGTYIRFEPAIAFSSKFYLLGLAGFERWASEKAYSQKGKSKLAYHNPIDYRDYAIGIGFDWDMLSRVGLHARVKYMQHDDINCPVNNYKTPVISTEIKMWF